MSAPPHLHPAPTTRAVTYYSTPRFIDVNADGCRKGLSSSLGQRTRGPTAQIANLFRTTSKKGGKAVIYGETPMEELFTS